MRIDIIRVTANESSVIAVQVGELLDEIMQRIDSPVFDFDLEQTSQRLRGFIVDEKNFVFAAKDDDSKEIIGFVTLYESFTLYAEGEFGTMAELYVRPAYRSKGIGKMLIEKAKCFGEERGWSRLEVTTPPLPAFDDTLDFYEREHFEITGGRKLKRLL